MSELIRALRALELNEYEARAYLALIERGPSTAYEVGKASGIPLSRCYEVARALAAKGLALVHPEGTPRYRALDPAEAVARRRIEQRRELDALERALEQRLAEPGDDEVVWVLRGRDAIFGHVAAMASAARDRLLVWSPDEAGDALEWNLAPVRARGVAVWIEWGSPALVVVRDRDEALVGALEPADRCLATLTTQPAAIAWMAARAPAAEAARVVGRDVTAEPSVPPGAAPEEGPPAEWLAWEEGKVRRLLASVPALASLEND